MSGKKIWPPAIRPGDTIGLVACSSPADPDTLDDGAEVLFKMGFNVVIPDPEFHPELAYLAGEDHARVQALHGMIMNPDIHGVMFTRGGYGALRIAGQIDYGMIYRHPKPIMGFSDATVLLSAISDRAGLVTYHGPVCNSLSSADQKTTAALFGLFSQSSQSIHGPGATVLNHGQATGAIAGGNLATCCHLVGTPWMPDWGGKIVVLEDVGEPAYKVDRMLTQMRWAGMFDGVRGIVAGTFTDGAPLDVVSQILKDRIGDLNIPVVADFPIGHGPANQPFPLGAMGRMDTRALVLEWELPAG